MSATKLQIFVAIFKTAACRNPNCVFEKCCYTRLYEASTTEVSCWLGISHPQQGPSKNNRCDWIERVGFVRWHYKIAIAECNSDLQSGKQTSTETCMCTRSLTHTHTYTEADSLTFSHRYLHILWRSVSLFFSVSGGKRSSGVSTVINQTLSTEILSLSVSFCSTCYGVLQTFPGRCQIPAVRNNYCPAEFSSTYCLSTPPVPPSFTPPLKPPVCRCAALKQLFSQAYWSGWSLK